MNYREAYGIHASNGILFNHEVRSAARPSSPARSRARSPRSSMGCRTGSISAISMPSATGAMRATMSRACGGSCSRTSPTITCSRPAKAIRCANSSRRPSRYRPHHRLARQRRGREGHRRATGQVLVEIDPRYFRPTEVDSLLGDPSKARKRARLAAQDELRRDRRDMVEADMVAILDEHERRNRHA